MRHRLTAGRGAGANDGIVSTASLVIAAAAGGVSELDILLTGVAGRIAGASSRRRPTLHLIAMREEFARQRDELVLARMVHHFVAHDMRGDMWSMLVNVVLEVFDGSMRAGYQHFRDAIESVAYAAEELVFGPNPTVMLRRIVRVRLDLVQEHLVSVELEDFSGSMIGVNDGVEEWHVSRLSEGAGESIEDPGVSASTPRRPPGPTRNNCTPQPRAPSGRQQ